MMRDCVFEYRIWLFVISSIVLVTLGVLIDCLPISDQARLLCRIIISVIMLMIYSYLDRLIESN